MVKVDLGKESWVCTTAAPCLLASGAAFDALWDLHPPAFDRVVKVVRARSIVCVTPRWQQCYCRPYEFSGTVHLPVPLPPELEPFLVWANGEEGPCGGGRRHVFNHVLVNWYANGLHYIGEHSDHQAPLVPGSPIACVSLGETRTMRVRDKDSRACVLKTDLKHGTCFVMGGRMQDHFTHEIPRVRDKTLAAAMGRRISIMFRCFAD